MDTLADFAKKIDVFVNAADTMANAYTTRLALTLEPQSNLDHTMQANARLVSAIEAYELARKVLVGDINDNEPEGPHNPL